MINDMNQENLKIVKCGDEGKVENCVQLMKINLPVICFIGKQS